MLLEAYQAVIIVIMEEEVVEAESGFMARATQARLFSSVNLWLVVVQGVLEPSRNLMAISVVDRAHGIYQLRVVIAYRTILVMTASFIVTMPSPVVAMASAMP